MAQNTMMQSRRPLSKKKACHFAVFYAKVFLVMGSECEELFESPDRTRQKEKRENILYIADLRRDSLIKVGITNDLLRRLAELRVQFGPNLEIFEWAFIPDGWGTPRQWEKRLKSKILRPRLLDRLEFLDSNHRDHGVIRCAGRAETVADRVELEKSQLWEGSIFAEIQHCPEPCGEVIKATRAEATIAFRELFAAASCGSATPRLIASFDFDTAAHTLDNSRKG
jgi:hypothetical protein